MCAMFRTRRGLRVGASRKVSGMVQYFFWDDSTGFGGMFFLMLGKLSRILQSFLKIDENWWN